MGTTSGNDSNGRVTKALPYISGVGLGTTVKMKAITGTEATKIDIEELYRAVSGQYSDLGEIVSAALRIDRRLTDPLEDMGGLYESVLMDARNGERSEAHDSIFANVEEARRLQVEVNALLDRLKDISADMQAKINLIYIDVNSAMDMINLVRQEHKHIEPASEDVKTQL